MKKGKNKNLLIIIVIILLVILISVGLMLSLTQKEDEASKDDTNKKEDNRCVESLCISKVSVEDSEESNGIIITLKNEGNETIVNQHVKLVTKVHGFKVDVLELEKGKEIILNFEKTDEFGEKIEDYKLIKNVEKENIEKENVAENNEGNQTQ